MSFNAPKSGGKAVRHVRRAFGYVARPLLLTVLVGALAVGGVHPMAYALDSDSGEADQRAEETSVEAAEDEAAAEQEVAETSEKATSDSETAEEQATADSEDADITPHATITPFAFPTSNVFGQCDTEVYALGASASSWGGVVSVIGQSDYNLGWYAWRNTNPLGGSATTQINSLGIAAGGQKAYALQRNGSVNGAFHGILTYDGATNTFARASVAGQTFGVQRTYPGPVVPGSGGSGSTYGPQAAGLVAGAVNPVNGTYVFGGYERSSQVVNSTYALQHITFVYFIYNPTTNTVSGPHNVPLEPIQYRRDLGDWPAANGDITFDAQGNLFVVVGHRVAGSSFSVASIHSIPGAQIGVPTNTKAAMVGYSTSPNAGLVNGVAFRSSGDLVLGDGSSGYIFRQNATTGLWTDTGSAQSIALAGNSGDLASCQSPPTIFLQKNVVDRDAPADQFTLQMTPGLTPVTSATATTSGSATGIQGQQIVAPTNPGIRHTMSESASGMTNLSQYTTTYQCTATQGSQVWQVASGTLTNQTLRSFDVTVPLTVPATGAVFSGNVNCVFTNTPPQQAKLTLVKDLQNTYGGSGVSSLADWTLTATGNQSTPKVITGTTGQAAITSAVVDPGSYALSEAGPAGYQASSWVCENADGSNAPVTSGAVSVVNDADITCTITNTQLPGTVTWTKTNDFGNAATRERLAGSEWRLEGPSGFTAIDPLTDCTAAPCNGPDKDPVAGQFRIEGLAWGAYTLTETKAPAGYELIAAPITFSVTASSRSVTLGDIKNSQREVPEIPLTGGFGADHFMLAGLGGLVIAMAFAAWRWMRKDRRAIS